jgi:hypothetical protein
VNSKPQLVLLQRTSDAFCCRNITRNSQCLASRSTPQLSHHCNHLMCYPAGWVGGIFTLLLFYVITLWSSLMLAECQETNGVKHPTYRAAVLHVLGEQQLLLQQLDVLVRACHDAESCCLVKSLVSSGRHAFIIST